MTTVARGLRAYLERPEPPSPEVLIGSVLEPGERLLWCGRPRPHPFRGAKAVSVLAFGVGFLACLVVTVVGLLDLLAAVLGADVVWEGVMWWVPLPAVLAAGFGTVVLGGLGYWPDETAYGVTDRHAVIVRRGAYPRHERPPSRLGYRRVVAGAGRSCRTVERLALHAGSTIVRRTGRLDVEQPFGVAPGDTIGTVTFDDFAMGGGEDGYTPAFFRIDDAAEVMQLIAATKAREEPGP